MSTLLKPNLMVDDMRTALAFYTEVLGMQFIVGVAADSEQAITGDLPDTPLQWAMLQREETAIMFQTRASLADEAVALADLPLGGSLQLYLEIDDLDALMPAIQARAQVIMGPRTTFYGMRELWFKDPSGYALVVAQKL